MMETNPSETQKLFTALDGIMRRMDTIELGFRDIVDKLDENTKATEEVRDWVSAFKAVRTVGVIIKSLSTWLVTVIAGGAAVVAILKWLEKQ